MKKYNITIFAAMLLLIITACSNNEYKASVDELRLVQVKPTNVYSGEIATILGRNFSIVPEENEITINGKKATVLEASKNDMKIILPELEPGTYPITVKSPSGELTGLEITYLKTPEHDYLVQTIIGQKGVYEMKDGVGTDATTKLPTGLAFAPDGSIWFTERGYNYIRRIAPDFSVSTLIDVKVDASSAIWQGEFNSKGDFYFADKAKGLLRKLDVNKMEVSTFASGLKSPMNVIFDDEDNIYVSARDNKIIYKYTPTGTKSTFAKLTFSPTYIVFDKNKNMIVGTSNGYCLIQIDKDGEQTTIAGDGVKGTVYD
jgi:IPT/TIG domain.